jgi:methionyl-tRNA formyltransferase
VGVPQDPALATEAPQPSEDDAAIRWTWSTERVLRHVRALAPAPGAWTEVAGSVVVVLEACAAEEGPGLRGVLRALAPSEGVVLGERVLVRTADGAVTLLAAEIDGATATVRDLAALFLSRSSMR